LTSRVRLSRENWCIASTSTHPARVASIHDLERLSDKAREQRLGQAGNPRLWADANRAILHLGYAVSTDSQAALGEATVWTIAGGIDVLLTVWWVRLKPDSVSPHTLFPILITMQPDDYQALDHGAINDAMLAEADALAADFLRDAGV
jgi:hypothetical protein